MFNYLLRNLILYFSMNLKMFQNDIFKKKETKVPYLKISIPKNYLSRYIYLNIYVEKGWKKTENKTKLKIGSYRLVNFHLDTYYYFGLEESYHRPIIIVSNLLRTTWLEVWHPSPA